MLTYDLKKRGKQPLYHYLYRCIRKDIEDGAIAPDEKLPSKRSLAAHLGVSIQTVQNAYGQLVSEGYISAVEKSGYFACKWEKPDIRTRQAVKQPLLNERPAASGWQVDFTRNTVLRELFPFSAWAKITRQILCERNEGLFSPLPHNGLPALRKAIAAYLKRYKGISVSSEQILIGAGTEYLYSLLVKLLGADQIYALEDPGYRKISRIYQSEGAACVWIPADGIGLYADTLENSGAQVVHVSPSHHFPTGTIMPALRRQKLLHWAEGKKSRYIIEDDYDSEFRYLGRPIPPILELDHAEKVLYMNTFSKTLSPAIRISYLILPPHLLERYHQKLGFLSCTVSAQEQFTLARFIETGLFERHLNRSIRAYKLRRDEIIHLIRDAFGTAVDIKEADSGLHFIAHFKNLNDQQIKDWFQAAGIHISCLSDYYHTPALAPEGRAVINYSGVDPRTLQSALQMLPVHPPASKTAAR